MNPLVHDPRQRRHEALYALSRHRAFTWVGGTIGTALAYVLGHLGG